MLNDRPYIIVTPGYTEQSAGVKSLHMLCDALNKAGQKASLMFMSGGPITSNPNLDTPVCEKFDNESIVVYPEIVIANPLGAKNVVRWLLYYAGAYRGNKKFPETDIIFGYTKRISADYGTKDVLFLPTVDEKIFIPPPKKAQRSGSCFYAHKYRIFKGIPTDTGDAIEIKNPGQSREEIIRLLQSSEIFYTYEDTALIIEAVLCGCIVVCKPSDYFKECCGLDDFNAGIAWGISGLGHAIKTIDQARDAYVSLRDRFWFDLGRFIAKTQSGSH